MSAELVEWIARLAPPISGDSRKELVNIARTERWSMHDFDRFVAEPLLQTPFRDRFRPPELAAVCRVWRVDFGDDPPGGGYDICDPYSGGGSACFSPPARRKGSPSASIAASRSPQRRRSPAPGSGCSAAAMLDDGRGSPLHSTYLGPRGQQREQRERRRRHDRARSPADDSPPPAPRSWPGDELADTAGSPSHPSRSPASFRVAAAEAGGGFAQPLRKLGIDVAHSIAVGPDGDSVYVAGRGGLACLSLPDLQLLAQCPYQGRSGTPGYAEVVAGDGFVVCVGLDGALSEHDPETCQLRCHRPYQPSVMEASKRLVNGRMLRSTEAVIGLEGGFGGAPRLAAAGRTVYLGGRDGVVTAYGAGRLNVISRCRLGDGAQCLGIRCLSVAPSGGRAYAAILSTLHVLALPSLQPVVRLRGGPRMPVFGSFCSAAESEDGSLAFAGDMGGPAVHIWSTGTWQWLARIDMASAGGVACHLTVVPGDWLLCASTDCGRFLAYGLGGRLPPRCVEEGSGGGPLAVVPGCADCILVLGYRGSQLALRQLAEPAEARRYL